MANEYITVEVDDTTYSVVAIEGDDGRFSPDIAELTEAGFVARKVVDGETTDESYSDARECLLRAMVHII